VKARFHPFSDLVLERYLAGELEPAEARRIEDAAVARPELDAHLRERRAEREAFKLRMRPLPLPKEPERSLFARWAFVAVAAAALVLAVVLATLPKGGGVAMRGDAQVSAHVAVQRGADVFEYREGVILQPNDRIRLTVRVAAPGFLTVVGRDARGVSQVLYENLKVEAETVLPDSLELDDTPGSEELFLFMRPQPAPAADLLERVKKNAAAGATVVKLAKGVP